MPLSAGDRLGPYEILALVGAGGMGEVYRALDPRLGREVAIKFLHAKYSDRLESEARAIAALNHPHICAIHDIGPDYLVMEYVQGTALKGPLPPAEAVRLGAQIAQALEAAHARGITHRDLKPANILVTASGVKLLDFGLAKLTVPEDSDATRTIAGTVMGTADYMSPEQAQGQSTDSRSDIFSFGVVLYEMLSGGRSRAIQPLRSWPLSSAMNRAPSTPHQDCKLSSRAAFAKPLRIASSPHRKFAPLWKMQRSRSRSRRPPPSRSCPSPT